VRIPRTYLATVYFTLLHHVTNTTQNITQVTGYSSAVAWNYDSDLLKGSGEGDVTVDEEKYEEAELCAAGVMQWLTGQRH